MDHRTTFSIEIEVHGTIYHNRDRDGDEIRNEILEQLTSALESNELYTDGLVKVNLLVNSDNLSQDDLIDQLPFGKEFKVLVDYDGEIVQSPFWNSVATPAEYKDILRYHPAAFEYYDGSYLSLMSHYPLEKLVEVIPATVTDKQEFYDHLESL